MVELTGRSRHIVKKRFLRKSLIVLQVEVEQDWREHTETGLHVGTHVFWTNATKQDLEYLLSTNRLKS